MDFKTKAAKLLDALYIMDKGNEDLVAYIAFVLESFYNDGHFDATHANKPSVIGKFLAGDLKNG